MPASVDLFKARFAELEGRMKAVPLRRSDGGSTPYADQGQFYSWASSALAAIEDAFGRNSAHATNFKNELSTISNNYAWDRKFQTMSGIFQGAKLDVDAGYVQNLERSISGEVFGDFVALAKSALAEGHHDVAAVLACAALEDALKRFALMQGLDVEGQTMEEVVNGLKTKGLVSGAQKALLSTMPKIRNYAMHADWSKLQPQDVGGVIGFVEQFLVTNF